MTRRRPLQGYFVALGLLVLLAGSAAAAYVYIQSQSDAERAATSDANFSAGKAAALIATGVRQIEAVSAPDVKSPSPLAPIFADASKCVLGYAPLGAFDTGRIDILRTDGTVICSSKVGLVGKSYGAPAWVTSPDPVILAPVADPVDGHPVGVFTFPVAGLGLLAWIVDLAPIGPKLASQFGSGVDKLEFLVVSGDGASVVARSIDASKWTGRSLAGTAFASSPSATDRSDLDGTKRLYGSAAAAGTGWKVYVGADRAAAFAPAGRLQQREIGIIAAGVILTCLALIVVYRQVARPLSVSLQREGAERMSAEQTYTRLFEGNPIPMTVTDVGTGAILQANPAASKAFGYTPDEFRGVNRVDFYVPADESEAREMERVRANIDQNVAKFGPRGFRRKDGSILRANITSYRVDLAGREAWVGLFEDVTERERLQQELEATQESFTGLFEGCPLPMLMIDVNTLDILDVNQACVDLMGYTREEFKAHKTPDFTVEDTEEQADAVRKIRAEQLPTIRFGPVAYRRRDGSIMRAQGTSYLVDYADRKVRIAMLEDVTEKEKIEQQLQQAHRLESLGQLAGGVAHDFNNLLTVILNSSASLKAAVKDASARRDLDRVDKAAQSASRLTRQLLAFARREVVPQSVLNVSDQVADLKDLLARTIGSHIVMTADLPSDVWPVRMDRGHLEQVVINLVVNARDAMPHGGTLSLTLDNFAVDRSYASVRPGLKRGRYVRLQVSDTGTGMDSATLQHAFEPFFTTKPVGKGTGMGLATVYGIVKQLGGDISIDSEVGRGTTFTVFLPATSGVVTADRPSAPGARASGTGTVLVVEDYADLRELFSEILSGAGYKVLTAPDGAAALRLARERKGEIDVLLTDVVMPNMLGPDLARELRAEQPGLRVLFMSGHAQPAAFAAAPLPAGAVLLQKPFMEAELLEKLGEVLSRPAAEVTR
jgi:PAS domain S-box-containing protein